MASFVMVKKAVQVKWSEAAPNIGKLDGYNTYVVGKWHVGTKSVPEDYGIKGHNFDGYGYPGSGVYKNLVFQPTADTFQSL